MPIDVLIVGAGPTGLLLASVLAGFGVSLRLIDKCPHPSQSSKALTVFARTLEIFEQMGIAEAAITQGLPLSDFQIYAQGDSLAEISFRGIDSRYPFVLSLPQSETEALLESTLEPLGVQVERSLTFTDLTQTDEGVTATLRHDSGSDNGSMETCQAQWLIGCDGARSTVRDVVGLTRSATYLDATLDLADVQLDWDLSRGRFRIFFGKDGVVGVVPLPQADYWRLIVTVPPEAESRDEPDLDWVEQVLQARSHHSVHLSQPIWASRFSIRQRRVDSVRRGRVLVAGDALSSHSPLGGQGMNAGLQDAYNLAWKLALVVQNRADEGLLESYGAERLPISQSLLRTTAWGTRFMMSQNPIVRPIRRGVVSLVGRLNWVQHRLTSTLSELTVNYRSSPIVQAGSGKFERLQVGDRVPDAELQQDNYSIRLFQVLSPRQFTLLIFTGQHAEPDSLPQLLQLVQDAEVHFSELIIGRIISTTNTYPESPPAQPPLLLDADGAAHRRYGAQQQCLYLIRPDGYVGYRSRSLSITSLKTYLHSVLGLTKGVSR